MNAIKYLLQVNFYLILFYGFYRILLRNETFHGNNRLFLVAGAMLSLLIPVWQFDWVQQLFLTEQVSEAVVYYMAPMQVVAIRPQAKPITWADLCFWIYLIGGSFFCIRFIINILNLRKLLIGGVMAFRAFTFGRKIYIDQNLPESQTILKHENVHAQQLHSFDVVFFEILLIFNWFNPILYAYRQSIKNIHEFLADEIAAQDFGKANYARLLLSQEFGVSPSVFTHQFLDQSSLKQRIIMLAKPKSKKTALLKYGLSMPLFVAMLIVSSAFVAKSRLVEKVADLAEKPAISTEKNEINAISGKEMAIAFTDKKIVYLLDGKEISQSELSQLKENTIKSVVILKDGKEKESFGIRADDGLVMFFSTNISSHKEATKGSKNNISINANEGYLTSETLNRILASNFETKDSKNINLKESDANDVDISITLDKIDIQSTKNDSLPKITNISLSNGEGKASPLFVIIDGIKITEVTDINHAAIRPENVDKMNVLKGKEAIAKYGEKGKNGVVEITKKLNFNYEKPKNELSKILVTAISNDDIYYTVDGKEVAEIKSIDPENIASVNVLKGEAGIAKFGNKAKNGAVEVKMKTKVDLQLSQEEEIFDTVEEQAEFPDGTREMYRYLGKSIKYPEKAYLSKVAGKVFLEFIIKKDGSITGIKILKGIGFGCDEEAVRVVKEMPKWTPAKQNGKIVNSKFTLPISFMLE